MIGRVEEEEEEGIDPTTSLFLSQPSSPSSLFVLGYGCGYGNGFTIIRSPSPPPLSPLWEFSDHHPEIQNSFGGLHNTIPTEVRSIPYFIHKSTIEFKISQETASSRWVKKALEEIEIKIGIEIDLRKLVGVSKIQGQVSPQSATVTPRALLLEAPKQDAGSAIIEAADYLSPNKAPLSLVEVSSSIVESTHGTCGLAVNTINQKKRTISSSESAVTGSSISLEVLQQHFSMTREKAAESLRVSVPTLKRSCRKHGISRWPNLKKTKKTPSLFDMNCVNVNLRDSIAGEFDKKIVTANPSLCHVQPMVPLRSLSGTLSLETLNQDVGSVTVHATGNIPLNDPSIILVDVASSTVRPTQKSNAIAKLYCEEQKSIVGCDVINGGDGIGEAETLSSMNIAENHKKITISSSKRAGTGTSISLEDLQQHCYMTRNEAAKKLGVSVSTLKRACREHKISSWLHLKRREKSESPSEMKSMSVTKQDIVTAGSSQADLRAVNSVQEDKFVTVKATYKDKMIRFDLPSLSKMVKLEEEVAKRLKLEVGSFSIEYVDEANDQILLACSDDLQYCIDTWKSLAFLLQCLRVKIIKYGRVKWMLNKGKLGFSLGRKGCKC